MRSRLAKRIVSFVITMSILLVSGTSIFAASKTPADQLNVGDTVTAGMVICNIDSHSLDAVLNINDSTWVTLAMGDWEADQTYTVTSKNVEYGMMFVKLVPSSTPQPSEPVPMRNYSAGDTIPAGTTLINDYDSATFIVIKTDSSSEYIFMAKGYTWTADINYSVTRVDSGLGLYITAASDVPGGSSSSISPEQLRQMSINTFVENLYLCTLGRAYEEVGRSHWTEALNSNATGTEVAWGFFNSPEFLAMNLSNEDYVRVLYRVFCGNFTPDASQVAAWTAELDSERATRDQLFNQFAATQEWANICGYYAVNV